MKQSLAIGKKLRERQNIECNDILDQIWEMEITLVCFATLGERTRINEMNELIEKQIGRNWSKRAFSLLVIETTGCRGLL